MWKRFTPEEDEFLKKNYLVIPAKRMAIMLGRHENTARQRMKILNIMPPLEVIQKFKMGSRFKPGCTPTNKGKKQSEYMTEEGIRISSATRYKKGNKPHNTKEGTGIIITKTDSKGLKYKVIKIADAHWQFLHRHIYEKEFGPIPKDKILVFKNGNQMDCRIENLELITRAENLERNSDRHYSPELKQAIRTLNIFTKKIKQHEKQN